jgi:hypothetical protein
MDLETLYTWKEDPCNSVQLRSIRGDNSVLAHYPFIVELTGYEVGQKMLNRIAAFTRLDPHLERLQECLDRTTGDCALVTVLRSNDPRSRMIMQHFIAFDSSDAAILFKLMWCP